MSVRIETKTSRNRRHARVRAKVRGTASRPRLSVFRSLRYVHIQIIDDTTGKVLAAVTDRGIELKKDSADRTGKIARAYAAGFALADMAKNNKVTSVVFDRGGYRYHGRVKAVAEGARDNGLVF